MAVILGIKKLFNIYLCPSGYDFSHFNLSNIIATDAAHYELLIMHVLSHPGFMLFTEGGSVDRIDKTKELADYPLARKILHPCFRGGRTNCSSHTCNKCRRALFAFDAYDKLDVMSEIYDVEKYRANKQDYLIELIKLKDDAFFSRLYTMFLEKYPKEMEKAQAIITERNRPFTREEFTKIKTELNGIKREYATTLALLSKNSPKGAVVDFFKSKGITSLYYAGKSQFGSKLVEWLTPEIEIVTLNQGNIDDCQAGFVASPYDSKIQDLGEKIKRKADRDIPVYSMLDLKKVLEEK